MKFRFLHAARRCAERALRFLSGILSLAILEAACSNPESVASSPAVAAVAKQTGALEIKCVGDANLARLDYTVRREGAAVKMGSFDVAGPFDSFSTLVTGLLPYDRYSILLRGQSVTPGTTQVLTCAGSAMFAVSTGQTTGVTLRLSCGVATPADPHQLDKCPQVDAVRATPREAPVGCSVALQAEANVADTGASPLRFEWSVNSGVLESISGGSARFECTEPGIATVEISLSDADTQCAPDTVPLYVKCTDAQRSAQFGGQSVAGTAGSAMHECAQEGAGASARTP